MGALSRCREVAGQRGVVPAGGEDHGEEAGEDLDEAHQEGEDADVDEVDDDDGRNVVGNLRVGNIKKLIKRFKNWQSAFK